MTSSSTPDGKELEAADKFVNGMVDRRDDYRNGGFLWHGWALRDAFFAGAHYARSERGLTDEATKLAEQWKERADDAGRLSRAVLTQPDVIAQVERALRKNPLIAMFLDQGFWHAHHVDIVIRHDGQDRRYEADWITELWYIVRRRGLSVTDAVKADQEGVAGGQSDPR